MNNRRPQHFAAAAAMIAVAITPLCLSSAARAARILVTIDATRQGTLKGSERNNRIPVAAYSFEIKSPRDAATGQATGRVQNLPLTITKSVDGASPQLVQALSTNEILKTVTIELLATNANGEETLAQAIKLTNASVSNIRQYLDVTDSAKSAAGGAAGLQEDVAFTFQTLEFITPGGASPAPTPAAPDSTAGAPAPTDAGAAAAPGATPTARPAGTPTVTEQPGALQPAQPVQTIPAARRRRPVAQPQPAPQPPPP